MDASPPSGSSVTALCETKAEVDSVQVTLTSLQAVFMMDIIKSKLS